MFRIVGYTGPEIDIELPDMDIDRDICDLTDSDAYEMDDCGNLIDIGAKAKLVHEAWNLIR